MKILYLQFSDLRYYPPIVHSSNILRQSGHSLTMLAIKSREDASSLDLSDDIERRLLLLNEETSILKTYARFVSRALELTLKIRPDIIYASDPLSTPATAILSKIHKARIIYHEHDAMTETKSIFRRATMRSRRVILKNSWITIFPNSGRQEFAGLSPCNSNSFVVFNCPSANELLETPGVKANRPFRLYYHGNLSQHRLPMTVLKALQQLPSSFELDFAGWNAKFSPSYIDDFLQYAKDLGLENRVRYHGIRSRKNLLEIANHCHLGLCLGPLNTDNPNEIWLAGASNKSFDYLSVGLPFLMNDLPDWNELYRTEYMGFSCNPEIPESIASAVLQVEQHYKTHPHFGQTFREKVRTSWNYESQFQPVLNKIDKLQSTQLHPPD